MKLNPIRKPLARKYNMYLRPNARKPVIWWSEYREDLTPKSQCKSTGFLNPDQFDSAVKWIEEQRNAWRGLVKIKAGRLLFDEAAEKYFNTIAKSKAQKTMRNIRTDIYRHLIPEFGSMWPKEISNDSWVAYVNKCRVHNPGQKFFNRRKTLISILNYLNSFPDEDPNFLSKVPEFDDVDPEVDAGQYIPEETMLRICKGEAAESHLLIMMGYYMGCRHGELVRIERKWIDLKEGFIHLPAHIIKTRTARDVRISKHVLKLVKKQYELTKDSLYLFPSPKYAGKRMSDEHSNDLWNDARDKDPESKAAEYRFHDLRHSCATNMAEANVPPYIACAQLGMSYKTFEKTYLKRRKSALKAAYEQWEGI